MTRFLHFRRSLIAVGHLLIFTFSLAAAFLLRFDVSMPADQLPLLLKGLCILIPVKMAVFQYARLNRGWWRYIGITDILRLGYANVVASVGFTVLAVLFIGAAFPRTVYFIDLLLCFLGTAGCRMCVRVYCETSVPRPQQKSHRVLLYGAGCAGATLLRELRANPGLGYRIVGLLDDDPHKLGMELMNVRILGRGRDAARIVDRFRKKRERVEEIIIAMPSATGQQMQEALANCRAAGVTCKTVPGFAELLSDRVLSAQIRNVSVTDLLGREPVHIEEDRIRGHIRGRSVLITGGAGSIGSELSRQIARFEPRTLVILDQAESDLFRMDGELRGRFPDLAVVPEIADIRDQARLTEVIRRHGVDSIFHAAAYKHVPMMEAHPLEAIRNNVMGTLHLARAAMQNGVSSFLMISSDKAVNPTSVMGVTKRVAELILSAMSTHHTRFVSVRFGNVLGSNGSVVPLFQAQIAAGGPVTVTHPEMRRYFMTIPEAVQLVLLASTMGQGSEVFVLDMGEPVRIVDLAKQMIRLAGFIPDEQIQIRFTGMRPGEKLYEELITKGENIVSTSHKKIRIFQGPRLGSEELKSWLAGLQTLLEERDAQGAVEHLKGLVPEYMGSARGVERSQVQVGGH